LLADARAALPYCDDPNAKARILFTEGNIQYISGRYGDAFPLFDEALKLARRGRDDRLISTILPFWLVIQAWRDPRAGIDMINAVGEVGIAGFSEAMGFQAHGWSRCWQGTCSAYLGRYGEAHRAVEHALRCAHAGRDPVDLALTTSVAAIFYCMWGAFETAAPHVAEGRRLAELTGIRMAIATSLLPYVYAPGVGELGIATAEFEHLLQRYDELAFGFHRPSVQLGYVKLDYVRGDFARAAHGASELRDVLNANGMPVVLPVALFAHAEILLAGSGAAAHGEVAALLEQAQTLIDKFSLGYYRPHLHKVRAAAARASGDDARAEQEMNTARKLLAQMGAPLSKAFLPRDRA
jgi:tetratricopeptide (TPR) repeat protein